MKIPAIRCKSKSKSKQYGKNRNTNLIWILVVVFLLFGATGASAAAASQWEATDTYRIINFAVLVTALFLLLRKPTAKALSSRIKGIKDQLEDLENRKTQAEQELAAYVEKISRLEKEAENIIEEYVKQGNEAKKRIIQEAETAAVKLEAQAKKNIEHEFEKAKIRLKEDVLDRAMARAEVIIQEKISGDDQERLVKEYLNKVVA
jgi:F-type H+-transporting ATPase subunit b